MTSPPEKITVAAVKGDMGSGNTDNPDTLDGVDPELTAGEKLIVTPWLFSKNSSPIHYPAFSSLTLC